MIAPRNRNMNISFFNAMWFINQKYECERYIREILQVTLHSSLCKFEWCLYFFWQERKRQTMVSRWAMLSNGISVGFGGITFVLNPAKMRVFNV